MAKKHSSLTTSDLHHPKGILVESTASMLVMSQSINTVTGSFHFIPDATNTYTLGNAARAWKELYVSTSSINFVDPAGNTVHSIKATADGITFVSSSGVVADVSGSVISGSKLHIVGDSFIGGDLTLGDADSDSISIGADLTSNLIPNADATYDLGSTTKGWNDLHLGSGGVINLDGGDVTLTHSANTITVAGGTLAAAAITGTTIDASTDFTIGSTVITDDSIVMTPSTSDTVTIAGATNGILNITTVDAAGTAGDINVTADGQIEFRANDAAGHIFDINGTDQVSIIDGSILPITNNDIDLGSDAKEFKDIWIDGTAYLDTVDIDAGAIDGTTIGANSAAAGTFTNLTVTTDVNIDDSGGDGAIDGVIIGASTAAAGTFTTLNTTGLTSFTGDVNLGDATSDTITATGRFDSDIVPSTDSARDLGTSTLQFAEAHIDTGHIDDITATGTSTLTTVDINGGAIDGTTIGAASHTTIKGTTIDATTDFTIDGLVLTADTITNDSNLTMDLAGDLAIDVDGGDVTITDNGADLLTINATKVSGSATSSGSFAHIAVNSVSASRIEVDSIQGNWTNAGNTIADLGSVTTVDINGGTINGITDLAVADGGTGASSLTDGGVLLGSGTGAITAMSVLGDGEMIVGDGSTDPVAESGATLRTSIGVGTGDSPTFSGTTAGNIKVGVTGDNELDTSSGNLTIDSAGGTITLDDNVIVSGDFTVSGTRTIVDSTTVNIEDNIIELNAGTSDGGLYVKETQGGAATGSMLWDVSSNRWFAGTAGSETNVVLVDTTDTLTNKTLTSPDINTPDIDGGTVDGATIATSDITVGSGKTLDVSGGTLTTSAAQKEAIMEGAGANIDIGSYSLTAQTLVSDVSTGTAPLTVSSTTVVSNLNADKLDGQEGSYYTDFSNMTVTAGEITHAMLGGDIIDGDNIGDDVINSEHYAAGSIDHEHLANDIIDGDNIQDDVINSEHYVAGSIDNEHLADDAVDSAELAAGAVDDAHLSDGVATGLAGAGMTATSGVMNVIGGDGITANANDVAVTAAQTTITSVLNTGLKVGYDNNDCFNFATGSDGQISVYQNMIEEFRFSAGGTFHADADVVAYSSTVASDMRLKENITDTKYGLSDIMKLRGVDYDWKRKERGHDIGVLAQEVEAVIPELVKEHEGLHGREKFKSVDYNKLVPVLIESIKELKKEIDDLKSN